MTRHHRHDAETPAVDVETTPPAEPKAPPATPEQLAAIGLPSNIVRDALLTEPENQLRATAGLTGGAIYGDEIKYPTYPDANVTARVKLPNGAAVTLSGAMEIGAKPNATMIEIKSPALPAAALPDGKTITLDVIESDNRDLSAPTVVSAGALVQTGAGGIGCAVKSAMIALPATRKKYYGLKATGSAAGNASAFTAAMTLRPS